MCIRALSHGHHAIDARANDDGPGELFGKAGIAYPTLEGPIERGYCFFGF